MKSRNRSKATKGRKPGLFITFEGTEGSGKTTQCRRLAKILRLQGYQVLETREPGGTPLAEAIRRLLLNQVTKRTRVEAMTPACEMALILAARAQHVAHVVRPALAKGMIVLCDRFFDSTVAYQGYGRNLDTAFLQQAHQFVTEGLTPHLTLLFDLPIQDGLTRRRRSPHQNRLDRESLDFHQRVRQGFLALARQNPKRIHTLNGKESPESLTRKVASMTTDLIQATPSILVHSIPKSMRTYSTTVE